MWEIAAKSKNCDVIVAPNFQTTYYFCQISTDNDERQTPTTIDDYAYIHSVFFIRK